MTIRRPPSLPQEYKIDPVCEEISIDDVVKKILSRSNPSSIGMQQNKNEIRPREMEELPVEGMPLDKALATLLEIIGNDFPKKSHPGYMGYVGSSGLPTDPLGCSLFGAYNHNAIGEYASAAITFLEKEFISNLAKIAGFPDSSGGLLCSGGATSNISALITAMHKSLGPEYKEKGINASSKPVILASDQAHFSIERACVSMGLGKEGLVRIDSNADYRMSAQGLRVQLKKIRSAENYQAVCVVANAGTTLTGAIDPLEEISEICKEYDVWMHVDAAYGGAALFTDYAIERLAGIELADSITIDLHKWLYQTYSGGILLYRIEEDGRDAFSLNAEYLPENRDGLSSAYTFYDLSLEISRPARILPVILSFYHYGTERLGRNIQHNIECAEYLAYLVCLHPELELIASPQLSICCFRFIDSRIRKANQINNHIIDSLRVDGDYYLSPALVDGKSILRVCICSYTTSAAHVEMLVERVIKIGCDYSDKLG